MIKIKKKILNVVTFILLVILFAGCNNMQTSNTDSSDTLVDGKITVYTSFYVMYDFANKIGGDKINVINLVPTGTEPHHWEPSPSDIVNLEKANVFIYSGAGMEGWTEKVLEALENENLIVIEATHNIELLKAKEHEEDANHEESEEHEEDTNHEEREELEEDANHEESEEHDEDDGHNQLGYDPHVWLDPMLAKKQMENIKEGLIKADPDNKDYYENNYLNYSKLLDELDEEFKNELATYTNRDIIVAHEAYGYLCKAYNLNQVAIEGLNADSEPSPGRMSEIIRFAKENNIQTIFFEELVSPKVAETIAKEIGATTAILSPLEGIKDEDLKAGKDYFIVMRDNLQALKKALE